MMKVLRQGIRRNYCWIILRKQNPFLGLKKEELEKYVRMELAKQGGNGDRVNMLIWLGEAIEPHEGLQHYMHLILEHSSQNIQLLQSMQAPDHHLICFQNLFHLAIREGLPGHKHTVANMYSQVFAHTLPKLMDHLTIHESLKEQLDIREEQTYRTALSISKNVIQGYLQTSAQLTLRQYLNYCRLFLTEVDETTFRYRVEAIVKDNGSQIHCLSDQDQCLLYYVCLVVTGKVQFIDQMGGDIRCCFPLLNSYESHHGKFVCMALTIMQARGESLSVLGGMRFDGWPYIYLVWAAEFVPHHPPILHTIISYVVKCTIPASVSIHTALSLLHPHLTVQEHLQLNTWLTHQIPLRQADHICKLVIGLHQHQMLSYYHQLLVNIIEASFGSMQLEHYNILYYHAFITGLHHDHPQNIEYLRRYILNGYAALGVHRKNIPTSSYFYKILQIVNVDQFYAQL